MEATFSGASEVGSPLGIRSVSLALSVWKIAMSKADLVAECTLEQDQHISPVRMQTLAISYVRMFEIVLECFRLF